MLPYMLNNMQAENKKQGKQIYDIFSNDVVREAMHNVVGNYFLREALDTEEGTKLGLSGCVAVLNDLTKIIDEFDFKSYIINQIKIEVIANRRLESVMNMTGSNTSVH